MKNRFENMAFPTGSVTDRFPRIARSAKMSAAVLLFSQFYISGEALGQTVPGAYNVDLAWYASASSGVTGYRIHYGTSSGAYTESIALGNVTVATVPGLSSGMTYYFAVLAIGAGAMESEFSNEASFLPGMQELRVTIAPGGEMVLTISGLIGQAYDVEASEDLKVWKVISTVTPGGSGSEEFSDPDAADYPKRFYRTRESQ